jgi:hypothetical protein
MTRFEEIQALVEKNKNKGKEKDKEINPSDSLEVPGLTESSKGGNPRMEFATDEQDPDLLQQLQSPKHKPNDGSNASYWDHDY